MLYIYDCGNYKLINKDLTKNWTHILKDLNVEDSLQKLLEALQNSADKYIPKRPITENAYGWTNMHLTV